MFCKFHRENPKNLQRHRVRAIEKRQGSPNAYLTYTLMKGKANVLSEVNIFMTYIT